MQDAGNGFTLMQVASGEHNTSWIHRENDRGQNIWSLSFIEYHVQKFNFVFRMYGDGTIGSQMHMLLIKVLAIVINRTRKLNDYFI